jgi:hypothetical protein
MNDEFLSSAANSASVVLSNDPNFSKRLGIYDDINASSLPEVTTQAAEIIKEYQTEIPTVCPPATHLNRRNREH